MRFFTLILFLLLNFCLICRELPLPGVTVATPEDSSTNVVLPFAEKMPEFPGGQAEFTKYLQKNIQYPNPAKEYGITGTVEIYFVVKKDGSISDVKSMVGVRGAPELTKEAIRVIRAMPLWKPGRMNGKIVNVGVKLPIRFQLG